MGKNRKTGTPPAAGIQDSEPRASGPATCALTGFPIWLLAAVFLATAAALIVLWTPSYLPFQDHPSHLYRQQILIDYDNPEAGYRQHFVPNLGVIPNQLTDLIIVGMGRLLSVPVETTSRLCLSLYIVALPVCLGWYLRRSGSRAPEYLLLGPLLTYSYFLLMGNENFVFSVPLFLALLALRGPGWAGRGWRSWLGGAFLATALYTCHMLSFGSAMVVFGVAALRARLPRRELVREAALFVPGAVLFLLYLAAVRRAGGSETQLTILAGFDSLATWARALGHGTGLALFHLDGGVAAWVYYAGLITLAGGGLFRRSWTTLSPVQLGLTVLAVLALILPEWLGVWRPGQRILLLAALGLTAVFPASLLWRRTFAAAAVILLLWARYQEFQFVREASAVIAVTVEPFQYAPLPRAAGGKVFPAVTQPYVQTFTAHRAFEYYHLRYGGVSPYHLMAADFSVRYREPLGDPRGLYLSTETDPGSLVGKFDAVLLIGKDGEGGAEWMEALRRSGWAEAAGNEMTGVFTQPAVP